MKHPFEDIKVVDLSGYIAGAYCTNLLADLGAQVVKIESHGGDGFRAMSGGFQGWNRGKRAIVLDLKAPEGRDILYQMVSEGDVVVENYRPGVAQRLGVDYETLLGVNPGIVYCTVAGYGTDGPHSAEPGWDSLLQALSGASAAQGGEGNPPVFLRVAISDYAAAILAAYGVAAALLHRARTGRGQRVETSLVNAAVAVQASEFFLYDDKPEPHASDAAGPRATYRLYRAADDWLFLSCEDDRSWAAVCDVLERPDLLRQFPDRESRASHDAEVAAVLEDAFSAGSRQRWLARLQDAGVRCAPSNMMTDVHTDPQAVLSGLTVEADSPDAGPIRQMGLPIKLYDTPGKISGPAPAQGQHTDQVLSELGYAPDAIASLRQRRVVG